MFLISSLILWLKFAFLAIRKLSTLSPSLSEYHVILQWRSDSSNQWNNGGHYGGQGYGGYANAAPQNPDMSMHAAAAVNGSS